MDATAIEESTSPTVRPRDVGGTGVLVSPIGIDGAVFGWAAGIDETTRVLDTYAAAGGNFVSTADHYAGGRSEVMIGGWLRTVSDRGSVVVETRVGRHPDAAGLSRRRMLRAVENSLTRLGTDYVDFLSFDTEDPDTPIEESLETGARLIAEGKVRFLSVSRFSAPAVRRATAIAAEADAPAFRAILIEYNLMERAVYEQDFQALAIELGRGGLARLPLANGYLTGRYRTRESMTDSVLFDDAARHIGRRGDRVLAALDTVAKDLGETPTTVAIAWVLLKPGIAATVLRAADVFHVESAMGATRVALERHHLTLLDKASAY